MYAGHPPFGQATPKDAHYKALAMGKEASFWKAHSRTKKGGENFFSQDFRDLMQGMMQLDPNQRWTMK